MSSPKPKAPHAASKAAPAQPTPAKSKAKVVSKAKEQTPAGATTPAAPKQTSSTPKPNTSLVKSTTVSAPTLPSVSPSSPRSTPSSGLSHSTTSSSSNTAKSTSSLPPTSATSSSSSSSSSPDDYNQDNFLKGTKPNVADFEMIKTIGTGMFGVIKIAKHIPTGKCVAIKILNKQKMWDLKQVEHVRSEKDILFKVAHPRIVNLLATMQDEESIYLIMEYISGGEIFSHLRQRNTFDLDTARYYVAQLITAITKLHSEGIAYRDIKPENLLLDRNGQLKMTDFGFAKKIDDISFTLCGTPEYLAPELVLNSGHDKGVDWWAVGILIYEMLEGFPPFFGTLAETYQAIIQYAPAYTAITDPDAKDLITRFLKKNKTKRLGCGADGALEVMNHPFFRTVDWKRIELGLDKAPLDVSVKDDFDTSNFPENAGEEEEEGDGEGETEGNTEEKTPMDPKAFDGYF